MSDARKPMLGVNSDPSAPAGLGWHEVDIHHAPFKLARFTVEPGYTSPVDSHAVHEVWFVATGAGELRYDGGALVIRIAEGDALYLEPPRTHQVHNDGHRTLVVHSIYWEGQR
jgi:mannose-6-phosphate isomerase-like protein (cupin superfamily)